MSKNTTNHTPENADKDEESILDQHESEQNVDPIPIDELKKDQQDEKKKHDTKDEWIEPCGIPTAIFILLFR